jgi:hypothetical protein
MKKSVCIDAFIKCKEDIQRAKDDMARLSETIGNAYGEGTFIRGEYVITITKRTPTADTVKVWNVSLERAQEISE